MAEQTIQASRFCSTCGAPRDTAGTCPACAARRHAAGGIPGQGRPAVAAVTNVRPRRSYPRTVVALAAAAALLATGGVAVDAHRDATTANTRLAAEQQRTGRLTTQLTALQGVQGSLNTRLAKVEASIKGHPAPAAIAKKAAPSVFTVVTEAGTGSGFVVSSSGDSSELVTNFHVVSDTYQAGGRTVKLTRDKLTFTGRIVRVSPSADLAVIEMPVKEPVLAVAAARPAVGDPLLVLGSPLGLGGTVTSGIVSAFRTEGKKPYMQFSAPISPGNSGGPVLDETGQVVGISVMKYVGDNAEGLSFAIPASRLCPEIDVC